MKRKDKRKVMSSTALFSKTPPLKLFFLASLPGAVRNVIAEGSRVIVDVGGDDAGATALELTGPYTVQVETKHLADGEELRLPVPPLPFGWGAGQNVRELTVNGALAATGSQEDAGTGKPSQLTISGALTMGESGRLRMSYGSRTTRAPCWWSLLAVPGRRRISRTAR